MIFAVTLAFFIVVLSGIAAARSVPAGLVTAARSFGATRRQIYLRIYLPAMEPLIIEGLRMGLIFTVTGVLLAEMYGAPRGIGRVIFAWGEMLRMRELLAGVLLVVAATIVCNELMRAFEEAAPGAAPGGAMTADGTQAREIIAVERIGKTFGTGGRPSPRSPTSRSRCAKASSSPSSARAAAGSRRCLRCSPGSCRHRPAAC